jgi:hypothetical protein
MNWVGAVTVLAGCLFDIYHHSWATISVQMSSESRAQHVDIGGRS